MWGLKLVALVVGLLVMVPQTLELSVDHPLYGLVHRINDKEGPFLGIIVPDSDANDELLTDSGYFVPMQSLMIAGRQFHIGKFRGMSAVYVRADVPLGSTGATVQLLIDTFRIMGIIDYGKCGSTSDTLAAPNVVVPAYVAYTSTWFWEDDKLPVNEHHTVLPSLKIGDYNIPKLGENELGTIRYLKTRKHTPKGSQKTTFWYYVDPNWLKIASKIEPSDLERCINGTICTDQLPEIIHGLRIASSDIYLNNVAYGNFLQDQFGVAAVDTVSAAVVTTAIANGLPHIVFRAASNKLGQSHDNELGALAAQNVLRVVGAFADRLSQKMQLQPQPRTNVY